MIKSCLFMFNIKQCGRIFTLVLLVVVFGLYLQAQEQPLKVNPSDLNNKSVQVTSATTTALPAKPAQKALDYLDKLEGNFKNIKTVKGEFYQRRSSEIFLEVIEAKGTFYFEKERKFRADHLLKEGKKWLEDNTLLISGDTLWLYSPKLKQIEKFMIQQKDSPAEKLHQMFLGFGPKTQEVIKSYEVNLKEETPKEFTLKFRPLDKKVAEEIDFVEITFNQEQLLPQKIYWRESSQDETTIELKKIKVNDSLPADIFKPDFPADAELIERN